MHGYATANAPAATGTVLLEGGECGDGIGVRREFDSRGSIISITASPQLTPRSA